MTVGRGKNFEEKETKAILKVLKNSKFTQLDNKWNSQIHYDGQGNPRPIHSNINSDTQLVHIQLRGRNTLTDEKIYDIVNKPINEWRHR